MKFELLPEEDPKLDRRIGTFSVQVFPTPSGAPFRVVTLEGEPWFVAKDVAEHLDYVWNGSTRIEHVPEEWRGVTSVVTPSGSQEMAVLSEQGLYFFLARSDKPKALQFQKWVAGEVLPKIRKTGSYVAPKDLSRLEILRMALDAEEKVQALEALRAIDAPKVAAQTLLEGAGGLFGVREAGKQLGIGQKAFVAMLLSKKIMYRLGGDLVPYQTMIDRGFFQTTTGTAVHGEDVHAWKQAKFTAKGIAWIAEKVAA